MKNRYTTLVVIILLFSSVGSFAQSETASSFKKFISQTFEHDLANLDNGNNTSPFLRAFTDDLIWTDAIVSTNGKVQDFNRGKGYLKKILALSSNTPAISAKWEIIKFDELKVRENTIIATFRAKTELSLGDEMVASGKNFVRVIANPLGDSYVISYLSILEVRDKVNIGPCYVNIQDKKNGDYFVTTYLPGGTNYDIIENEFTFSQLELSQAIQIKDGKKYFWNPDTKSISLGQYDSPKLAVATSKEFAIMEVIKLENAPTCSETFQSFKEIK